MEHKVLPFTISGPGTDITGRVIEGYAAAFGNIDKVNDIIHPGAFAKTLMERGQQVKFLYQHDPKELIGKPLEMKEDSRGLFIRAFVSDTARGRDVLALAKDGVLDGLSIGYDPVITDYTEADVMGGEKKLIRNLREIKLYEFSAVTFGANELATVTAVKQDGVGPAEGKPYIVAQTGTESEPFCVYKRGADGKPMGESMGCHPSREQAQEQIAAIWANEGKQTEDGGPSEAKPIEENENSIRVRVRNPGDFQEGTFRTIDIDKGKGIQAVLGRLKGETSTTIQTYIFDKTRWDKERATAWVKDHEEKPKEEDADLETKIGRIVARRNAKRLKAVREHAQALMDALKEIEDDAGLLEAEIEGAVTGEHKHEVDKSTKDTEGAGQTTPEVTMEALEVMEAELRQLEV